MLTTWVPYLVRAGRTQHRETITKLLLSECVPKDEEKPTGFQKATVGGAPEFRSHRARQNNLQKEQGQGSAEREALTG